jgi:ubiquinone/menaquinone biosynthesis C-methylase UbiE
MSNPSLALAEIHRVLKRKGYLLMAETVEDNPFIRTARIFYPKWRGDPVLSRFRKKEIKDQVENY